MQVAFKLRKDYEEILDWPKDKFELWVAFFKLQIERENTPRTR